MMRKTKNWQENLPKSNKVGKQNYGYKDCVTRVFTRVLDFSRVFTHVFDTKNTSEKENYPM